MAAITESTERFRVFVNLSSSACASRCSYCYVPQGRPQLYEWRDIESALRGMIGSEPFAPGRHGTIVTFGGHTELFRSRQLIDLLIRALSLVCPLGNPVQVSTKQFVSIETLKAIHSCIHYPGQLAMFVSCASTARAALVEPGADEPATRWLTFVNQRAFGLSRALLIKPWLGSTTKHDLITFAKLATDCDVNAVCVGSFYVTQKIRETVATLDCETESVHGTAKHPLIREPHFSITPPTSALSEFRARLNQIPLFSSSICISTQFAKVGCPLHGEGGCHDVF